MITPFCQLKRICNGIYILCVRYGTDAVVYLKTLTHEASELLPVFNKTSTKQYSTAIPTADWTDPSFTATRGSLAASKASARLPTSTSWVKGC